jgi:hypothetical protein
MCNMQAYACRMKPQICTKTDHLQSPYMIVLRKMWFIITIFGARELADIRVLDHLIMDSNFSFFTEHGLLYRPMMNEPIIIST